MKPGEKLHKRLKKNLARKDLLNGLALVFLLLTSLILSTVVAFLVFSPWFYLLVIVPLSMGAYYVLTRPNLYQLACRFEVRHPGWKDRLSTAVDLSTKRNPREVYSTELTSDYVDDIESRLAGQPFTFTRERRRFALSVALLGTAVAVLLMACVLFPARISFGRDAIFAHRRLELHIESLSADTLVNEGDHIEVAVRINAPIDLRHVYMVAEKEGKKTRHRIRVIEGEARQRISVDAEQHVWFERLGRRSDEVYLGLARPFGLENLTYTVNPPSYTGRKPRSSSGLRVLAMPGSQVKFKGQASGELGQALLIVNDEITPLSLSGREFSGEFDITGTEDISLTLTDRVGTEIHQDINVDIQFDEVPLVEVFLPGKDTDVNRSMILTLGTHVLDDFGLGRVRLVYEGSSQGRVALNGGRGRKEDTIFYRWDLSSLDLLPGEEITYYIEARDNDVVSGPKSGRSRVYRLRFPDIDEMFSEVTEHGEHTAGGLRELSDRQGELSEELFRIEQKLRAEQALSSQEQERLRELIEKETDLLSAIDSLAEETRKLLESLEQGMISDPETLAKLASLSQMLSDLMPPELRQKLSELSRTLGENPDQLDEVLRNAGELNVDLSQQLEQAMSVLERFMQEQRLSELAEKALTLAEMEKNLIQQADELSSAEAAARQHEIEQGLKEIAEEASELASELAEQDIAQQLREMVQHMEGENTDLSQDVERSIAQGNMNKSSARRLERNLRNAGSSMNQLASNLVSKRTRQLEQEMANLARELLILSEEQEKLLSKVGEMDDMELAARVTELERALEREKESLFRLASQSFNVPRDAVHSLSEASRSQLRFKESLIAGQRGSARTEARSAQTEVDRAVSVLLSAFARMSGLQSTSSTGLEQLMQSLSSMSLAQLQLNQQLGGLLPLPISASQLSEGQRQALSELISQQAALRQELEQLARAGGQEPGFSGMLEGIIEEMKAMEEDMSRLAGERELVDRGEHIFRRLLDARNVLRKKDQIEEREREVGTVWEGLASPAIPAEGGERRLWIKKELLRFLASDYPESYKRLARAYLEALLEQE